MITLFYACSNKRAVQILTILALVLSFLTGRQRFKTETNLAFNFTASVRRSTNSKLV